MEYNKKVNVVQFYIDVLKRGSDFCGRGCKADLVYGSSRCIGRISPLILRPVLFLDDGTFVINSVRKPSKAVKNIPNDCPFFGK